MSGKLKETEVVSVLVDNAKDVVNATDKDNDKDWYITKELDAGYGIADLVLFNFDQSRLKERISRELTEPILSRQAVKTIIAFKQAQEPISVSYLTKQLGITEQSVKYNIINFLVHNGYVVQSDEDKYRLAFDYELTLSSSIAIEAKISNWKRGLYQAYRYKWFSNQSYLALYYKFLNPALAHLDQFKRLNVGLLSVTDNSIEVIYKPDQQDPISPDFAMISNEKAFRDYLEKPLPIH